MDIKEPKQVIVVRTDLNMSPGKAAAQVAHASVSAILNFAKENRAPGAYRIPVGSTIAEWYDGSQVKIVVAVKSEEELNEIWAKVCFTALPYALITAFCLWWIVPFAAMTMKSQSWLTR